MTAVTAVTACMTAGAWHSGPRGWARGSEASAPQADPRGPQWHSPTQLLDNNESFMMQPLSNFVANLYSKNYLHIYRVFLCWKWAFNWKTNKLVQCCNWNKYLTKGEIALHFASIISAFCYNIFYFSFQYQNLTQFQILSETAIFTIVKTIAVYAPRITRGSHCATTKLCYLYFNLATTVSQKTHIIVLLLTSVHTA